MFVGINYGEQLRADSFTLHLKGRNNQLKLEKNEIVAIKAEDLR